MKDFKRADQYTLRNINCSGTKLRSTLACDIITKVLTINTLNSDGPDVFMTNTIPVRLDSYDALEATLTNMKILSWLPFSDLFSRLCPSIASDAERLDSSGALKPDHLADFQYIGGIQGQTLPDLGNV